MTFTEPAPPHTRQRWRLPKLPLVGALLLLVGAGVFLYPQAAAWTTQKNQAAALSVSSTVTSSGGQGERDAKLLAAREYNNTLASGALLQANANVPTGDGTGGDDRLYWTMLDNSTGIMARLRYEKVGIDLPVYHGTSDVTLLRGVGHLQGTSLPVGGVGTRAVLTGHRGLAEATMFTHLDKAEIGDIFTIEVEGEALSYQVFDTKVIDPADTEALRADPTRDLVTLVTCTPLGINTQRILVTAERVTPTPLEAVQAIGSPSHLPGFPWWAVILGAVLVCAVAYVWWSGYPAKTRAKKGPGVGNTGSAGADSTGTQE